MPDDAGGNTPPIHPLTAAHRRLLARRHQLPHPLGEFYGLLFPTLPSGRFTDRWAAFAANINQRADRFAPFDPMEDGGVWPLGVANPQRVANPAWADQRRAEVLGAFDGAARWANQAALLDGGRDKDCLAELDDLDIWAGIGESILRAWGSGHVFDSEIVVFDESPVRPPREPGGQYLVCDDLPLIDVRTDRAGVWYWPGQPHPPDGWAGGAWQSRVLGHWPAPQAVGAFEFLIEPRPLTADERDLLLRIAIVMRKPGTGGCGIPPPERVIETYSVATRDALGRLRRLCPTVSLPPRLAGMPTVREFDDFFDALRGWLAAAQNAVDERRAVSDADRGRRSEPPAHPGDAPAPPAGAAPAPFVPLLSWGDILEALNDGHPEPFWKNNARMREQIRALNEQHGGPITFPRGRGKQPRVDRAALLAWWEGLRSHFTGRAEEAEREDESARLTASDGYDHGREGHVLPGMSGHVKKCRKRQ